MACNIIQLGRIRTKFNLHISVYKSQILKSKSFSETLLGGCAVCTRQTSTKWISFFRPLCINYSSPSSIVTSFPLEVIRGPDPDFFPSCSSNFLALRQEKRVSITESSFGKLEIGVVLHFSYGSNPICTVSNSMPGMMRFRAELNRDYNAGPADWSYTWLGSVFDFKKQ